MEELIRCPLNAIATMLQENPEADVSAYFIRELQGNYHRVPLFNVHNVEEIRPNSLVRFRCMVQDMSDPEIYAHTLSEISLSGQSRQIYTKYQESVYASGPNSSLDSSDAKFGTRLPTKCVSIPAESSWVHEHYQKLEQLLPLPLLSTGERGVKRQSTEEESMGESEENTTAQRIRIESSGGKTENLHPNGVVAKLDAATAIVKFYDEAIAVAKLNDTLEVLGIFQLDPAHPQVESEFFPSSNSPTAVSAIPCIHAISVKNHEYFLPCEEQKRFSCPFSSLREAAMMVLMKLTCYDRVCAEYLMMLLASHVYGRKDSMCIGNFALNIYGADSSTADLFTALAPHFLPRCQVVSMDVASLNRVSFVPRKDYEQNVLISGMLQVPPRTTLILDETKMTPGTLIETGIRNLQAITDVILWQKLGYDFKFYPVEFLTDIQAIILSEGKSMLPGSICIRLEADESQRQTYEITDDIIRLTRAFVGEIGRIEPNIDDATREFIEVDFVEARKADPVAMSGDVFHRMITLGRLLAATHGEQSLTQERWSQMKELERQRLSREKK